MSCFLGIDAGTSGIKAIVLEHTGRILGEGYAECNVVAPKPGWAEEDPLDWWEACKTAVGLAVSKSGRGKDIEGIGFSGQMQGSTLMDADMNPVDNCIIWMDQRASAEADELNTRMPREEMLDIAANFCLPSYWAPKLLWLQKHKPDVFERTKTVLFTKDYLRYRMTGEVATEVSDASCSFLLDMKKRAWSPRLFEAAGLPMDMVPRRLLESQDVAGYLRADLAEEWGMRAGIPVAAGGGDQTMGGVGSGVVRPGVVAATIGTSGVVFGCCETPFVDEERRAMYSLCHSVPGVYSYLGCTLGAGGSYKWLRDTIFAAEKDAMEAKGENIYAYMDSLAEKAPVGSEGLAFLPYLSGEGTPHVDPDARGVFFGLSYRHGRGDLCRSIMEGVTFSLRDTIEILRATGRSITQVRAMGGGAKSPLWRQIQADVYNATVITMNMEEGPAAGAAILAAVASGFFKNVEEGCSAILKPVSTTEPIAKNAAVYDEYYQTYHSLYPTLKETFARQASLVEKQMSE